MGIDLRRAFSRSLVLASTLGALSFGATPAKAAGANNVVYEGGHVISRAEVVLVFWGAHVPTTATMNMEAFYKALVNSPYMDWPGEYDTAGATAQDGQPGSNQHIYRGTFLKTVTITPSNAGTAITDAQIGAELTAQIASSALPTPKIDAEGGVDTLYMIYFPPGVVINDGSGASSCNGKSRQAFCGFHSTVTMKVGAANANVAYGVIPDLSASTCGSGCGGNTLLESYGVTSSHELVEAITDPEIGTAVQTNAQSRPIAWYDDQNGEIGDICADPSVASATIGGFTVQQIWSQRLGKCIAEDPSLPLCKGATRPCRPCDASDDGTTCSGATPVCETDATSASFGQCVACNSNAQCTGNKPFCDKASDTCRGCAKDAECGSPSPKCNATTGQCGGCATNADCSDPSNPICNTSNGTCRACMQSDGCATCSTDDDCKDPSAPSCDPTSHACVGRSGGGGISGGSPDKGDGGAGPGSGNGLTGNVTTTETSGGCSSAGSPVPSFAATFGVLFGLAAMMRRRKRD